MRNRKKVLITMAVIPAALTLIVMLLSGIGFLINLVFNVVEMFMGYVALGSLPFAIGTLFWGVYELTYSFLYDK